MKIFAILLLSLALASCQAAATPEATATLEPVDTTSAAFSQLDMPKDGEEIAVIETSMGTIKLRLFPEVAPKAVENFTTHAKDGYYDGLTFHRVIDEFMAQGGDPEGTGMGGESIWGKDFAEEYSLELHHFRGALAMAKTSQPNSQGSQFYIVQSTEIGADIAALLEDYKTDADKAIPTTLADPITSYKDFFDNTFVNYATWANKTGMVYSDFYNSALIDKYASTGGTPMLDYGYTVFGQAFEGIEILDLIAKVATDADDKPLEDVLIVSIKIEQYKK